MIWLAGTSRLMTIVTTLVGLRADDSFTEVSSFLTTQLLATTLLLLKLLACPLHFLTKFSIYLMSLLLDCPVFSLGLCTELTLFTANLTMVRLTSSVDHLIVTHVCFALSLVLSVLQLSGLFLLLATKIVQSSTFSSSLPFTTGSLCCFSGTVLSSDIVCSASAMNMDWLTASKLMAML